MCGPMLWNVGCGKLDPETDALVPLDDEDVEVEDSLELNHPAESSENTSKCDSYQKIRFKVLTWKSMRKFFFS